MTINSIPEKSVGYLNTCVIKKVFYLIAAQAKTTAVLNQT